VTLLTALDAFYTEHRRCGELEVGVEARPSGSTASAARGSPAVLATATYLTSTVESPHHPGMDRRRFLLTSRAGALDVELKNLRANSAWSDASHPQHKEVMARIKELYSPERCALGLSNCSRYLALAVPR
jgi:hypothetical protein